jgi:hypothetical protein
MNQAPNTPDFTTWTRGNLEAFALEAYLKLQDQRELIEWLRHLVATQPKEKNDERTTGS